MIRLRNNSGSTLIEVIVVLILLGIISGMALTQMGGQIETAQNEQTKQELDNLARAIVGNADLKANGARTNFGYVGDVGSFPPSLQALVQNPGGYATWNGPYIDAGSTGLEYSKDAWQVDYVYFDTVIRSTGSGSNLDKVFAPGSPALLNNTVEGYLVDAGDQIPGAAYMDSVMIQLNYPNGSGGIATPTTTLSASGNFSFAGVPIGSHTLYAVHLPTADTASYQISVLPGEKVRLRLVHPADLW